RETDLSTTSDVRRDGDTGGLDLPVGHVRVLERLDPVLAEVHVGSAGRVTSPVRTVLLPVLDPTRNEHFSQPSSPAPAAAGSAPRRRRCGSRGPRGARCWAAARSAACCASRPARLGGASPPPSLSFTPIPSVGRAGQS